MTRCFTDRYRRSRLRLTDGEASQGERPGQDGEYPMVLEVTLEGNIEGVGASL